MPVINEKTSFLLLEIIKILKNHMGMSEFFGIFRKNFVKLFHDSAIYFLRAESFFAEVGKIFFDFSRIFGYG